MEVHAFAPHYLVYATAQPWPPMFAAGPPLQLPAPTRPIDEGLDGSLPHGLDLESRLFAGLFDTEDQKTGMRSFLESGPGKATFQGR